MLGRPRDPEIDERVMAVARRHLAQHGYDGMSLTAIAGEAGTTRQALYRRWPTKADLATAAVAAMSRTAEQAPTEDMFADLVRELDAFRRGIGRPDGVSMVGTMLVTSTDPEIVTFYRERIVAPRRAALREILERARDHGLLSSDADIDAALGMFPGSWYARSLQGVPPLPRWAERTAAVIWRGLGGTPS
ncbi:MAG: TetR/AcrR family transcriptional regulator [Thermoleophilia bacterium]|nr:TetR/AcrR family transcriptional regulator [Thermoleophilia bacterium]